MRDEIVIAGAGPAGSIAALLLARAGCRVRLLDRATFPRDKLCGDTISPGTLDILRRLGIGDGIARAGIPIRGMVVTGSGGARVRGECGRGVEVVVESGADAIDGGLHSILGLHALPHDNDGERLRMPPLQ